MKPHGSAQPAETLYGRFREVAETWPQNPVFLTKEGEGYAPVRFETAAYDIRVLAARLRELGVRKGDRVAILSYNRQEWALADFAILALGAIVVPICDLNPPAMVKFILQDAEVSVVFVEKASQAKMINEALAELPLIKSLIRFERDPGGQAARALDIRDLLVRRPRETIANIDEAGPDDTATIVYTSGTTGNPKGVMLTHRNILSNVRGAIRRYQVTAADVMLSYLPLSHMFERTAGYYTVLLAGGCIAFAEHLAKVTTNLREVAPTVLLTVPRVLEKIREEFWRKIERSGWVSRTIAREAIRTFHQVYARNLRRKPIDLVTALKDTVFRRLVLPEFKAMSGGRVRVIVCGGAPLNKKISHAYSALGFNLVEGYGMTEAGPVIASNRVGDNAIGSVGKPFDGVEVTIDENGEILVRGDNVMKGYWNNPAATAEIMDGKGFLHTGDLGRFDKRGHLIITGKSKEIIVTSFGKKFSPYRIEKDLKECRHIEDAVIFGDHQPCNVALIVPDREKLEHFARRHRLAFSDWTELFGHPDIRRLIRREIDHATRQCASYEKMKTFHLSGEKFTVENGMMTISMKIRRTEIFRKYKQILLPLFG